MATSFSERERFDPHASTDLGEPPLEVVASPRPSPLLPAEPVLSRRPVLPRNPSESRPRVGPRHTRWFLAVTDCVGVGLSIGIGLVAFRLGIGRGEEGSTGHLGMWMFLYIPVYSVALGGYGLYRRERRRLFSTNFPDLVYLGHALIVAGAGVLVISHLLERVFGLHPEVSLTGAVFVTLPALLTIPAGRVVGGKFVARRGLVRSRALILGSGTVADSVARRLANFDDVELLGCVDDAGPFDDGGRGVTSIGLLGEIADLPRLCAQLDADRIIVAFSPAAEPDIADVLRQLPPSVQVSVVPRLFDLVTWRSHIDELHGLPVMDVAPPTIGPAYRVVKRALDLTVSVGIMIVSAPIWLAIAIAIKLTSAGPVLYRQDRRGRGGEAFQINKFRTMRVGADQEIQALRPTTDTDGGLFKLREDPRVTKVGGFLRKTSLDELPQLLNVLRGDMSLVGPRPFVPDESDRLDGWAARRFDVRPGLTGLWQVSGRSDLPFEELRRLDYAYVASWSLWWDLKILWQTPGSVLRRHGAY